MPPTYRVTNNARHLEAWEGVSPEIGARTRRRTAKIESAFSQSTLQPFEARAGSSGKENEAQSVQRSTSVRRVTAGVIVRHSRKGINCKEDLRVRENFGKTPAIPKRQCQSIEHAVTAQIVPDSATNAIRICKPAAATKLHVHEDDGDGQMVTHDQVSFLDSRSPEHESGVFKRELSDQPAVLEPSNPPEHVPATPGKPDSCATINVSPLHDTSSHNDSDSDQDSKSEITMTSSQEEIDQLKAMNEDLKAESKYYRLMAEITIKTTAVRRGYMRSPIVPSCLTPRLRGVHERLLSDGLQMPNTASDRAHTVADAIELHLTWEIENLKHSVTPSVAVNSFTEFAALFVPQIHSLAVAEFVGGEETNEVRETVSVVVLRLICWIVEQCVTLAETVAPQYLSYQAVMWSDEGVSALRNLDACLEGAFQRRLRCFPEAKMPESYLQVQGLYAARIMDWAFTQLISVNKMAGRLERKIGKVPSHYGVEVELFGFTRRALKDYLRWGQYEHEISKQSLKCKAVTAMLSGKGED